jgi:hypothetical protein
MKNNLKTPKEAFTTTRSMSATTLVFRGNLRISNKYKSVTALNK